MIDFKFIYLFPPLVDVGNKFVSHKWDRGNEKKNKEKNDESLKTDGCLFYESE